MSRSLERRIAELSTTKTMKCLGYQRWHQLVVRATVAESIDDLPAEDVAIIKEAEQEILETLPKQSGEVNIQKGYESQMNDWIDERRIAWVKGLTDLGATEQEIQELIDEEFNKNYRSIGAIVGDIAGSRHEFNNTKSKEFELLADNCYITDDSVLTIATMKALMDGGTAEHFAQSYRAIAQSNLFTKDLHGVSYGAGYGARFFRWVMTKDAEPYDSFGNGAPMRVSPIAWFYDDLDDVERVAEISASVSHNHPEGIKGAKSVAGAILLARMGKDKPSIKKYVEQRYGYDLNFTLDEIRDTYQRSEASQDTVPQAIIAFLEGRDFEDVIRNAVSIGGDSDTISDIAGSIAEAFYGIPHHIHERTLEYLPSHLFEIVASFSETLKTKNVSKVN